MAKKAVAKSSAVGRESLEPKSSHGSTESRPTSKPAKSSSLLDTRVVYCGANLEQLGPCRTGKRWGETKEKRAFEDRHENTKAYIDYLRPRCKIS